MSISSIINSIKKNNLYKISIIIIIVIVLYFTFYTNYIINNSNQIEITNNMMNNTENNTENNTDNNMENNTENNKHVHFDINKNEEIVYETDTGKINIDYNTPELDEYQRISKCSYPMNNNEQINVRDCAIDKTCLSPLPDKNWFREQRTVKTDLPGYNGSNLANFTFNENINNDRMMRNMIYDDNYDDNENNYNENLSPLENKEHFAEIQYQSASPVNETPKMKMALPNDLCRSCIVGTCTNDICTSQYTTNDYNDYNYH